MGGEKHHWARRLSFEQSVGLANAMKVSGNYRAKQLYLTLSNLTIGGLEKYSSIIATTGKWNSPAVLFYNTEKWQLVVGKSLPSDAKCLDGTMPFGPYSAQDNRFKCANDGVCCQGANSSAEPGIK